MALEVEPYCQYFIFFPSKHQSGKMAYDMKPEVYHWMQKKLHTGKFTDTCWTVTETKQWIWEQLDTNMNYTDEIFIILPPKKSVDSIIELL